MPIDIREQASENLRFIRGAMERAERVSAVSGIGLMAMGAIGLVAMAVASGAGAAGAAGPGLEGTLSVWVGAAIPAALCGGVGSWIKARNSGLMPLGDPGRRLLLCLVPALAVGALLTIALWQTVAIGVLPSFWMLLYGTGVLAAGTYAAAPIMLMGAGFLVAGLFAQALSADWSNVLLGATFGGLHVYFGYQVYRNHGG